MVTICGSWLRIALAENALSRCFSDLACTPFSSDNNLKYPSPGDLVFPRNNHGCAEWPARFCILSVERIECPRRGWPTPPPLHNGGRPNCVTSFAVSQLVRFRFGLVFRNFASLRGPGLNDPKTTGASGCGRMRRAPCSRGLLLSIGELVFQAHGSCHPTGRRRLVCSGAGQKLLPASAGDIGWCMHGGIIS